MCFCSQEYVCVHCVTQICGTLKYALKCGGRLYANGALNKTPPENNLLGILFWEYSTEFRFSLMLYPPGVEEGVLSGDLKSFRWSYATRTLKPLSYTKPCSRSDTKHHPNPPPPPPILDLSLNFYSRDLFSNQFFLIDILF